MKSDSWSSGEAYEPYVGRWSRRVAEAFVGWLNVANGARWLDVGCGTGALTEAIASACSPQLVTGIDPSSEYLKFAERRCAGLPVKWVVGELTEAESWMESYDAVVAGLVLNFLPDPSAGVRSMVARTAKGGTVAAYVWDYAKEMQMMRCFWDAAISVVPSAEEADGGRRFAKIANPQALAAVFDAAGLTQVETRAIRIATVFADFDDYWLPLLSGQGSAAGYARSLEPRILAQVRSRLIADLPRDDRGRIKLEAVAWAVKGRKAVD